MPRNSSSYSRPAKQTSEQHKTTVVLLAGNLGFRMTTYGPQCLQKLSDGDFLLTHQVKAIRHCIPNCEIMITCREYSDKLLRNKPDDVRLIETRSETNEVEEIRVALNNSITDSVLFIGSDTYFDKNLLNGLDLSRSFVIFETQGMMRPDSVGMTVSNDKATIMSYSLDKKWVRIFNINKTGKISLNNFCKQEDNKKMYAHEALNYVMDKCPVYAYETKSKVYCIDRVDDLKGLEKL